ncbi:MAG: DNA ligase [Mesorhizobium sp.]|nr:MAG: DNA ligase [Mesorhizobium sp.]
MKFIKPLEPVLVEEAPVSDDWLHEIKYDGFRTQLILDWAGGRAFTRTGNDWSKRYWPIVAALEKLPAKALILDGEMIAPEPDGKPNFHEMHSRMAWNAELLAFVAFDILHKDGRDLRPLPAIERREILWDVVKPAAGIIQYSQHIQGGGADFFAAVEKMGLEGVVSKRRNSPYRSGSSDSWVKTKCTEIGDFDLLGIQREPGKATMALMARNGKYAGKAVISAGRSIKERLWKRVQQAKAEPPDCLPKAVIDPSVEWVKPGIKARVKYLRGELKLRHASVQGFSDTEPE